MFTFLDNREMPKIAFLGAGSVVFTRQLLTDLLRFPDLPTLDLALHDIDADAARGRARAPRCRSARAARAPGDDHGDRSTAARPSTARTSSST